MPLQSLSCMHIKPGMAHLLDTHAVTRAGSAVLGAAVARLVVKTGLRVVAPVGGSRFAHCKYAQSARPCSPLVPAIISGVNDSMPIAPASVCTWQRRWITYAHQHVTTRQCRVPTSTRDQLCTRLHTRYGCHCCVRTCCYVARAVGRTQYVYSIIFSTTQLCLVQPCKMVINVPGAS